ncbi:MAG: hypothetical protein AAF217_02180 [Pseudomonadota bacterium]
MTQSNQPNQIRSNMQDTDKQIDDLPNAVTPEKLPLHLRKKRFGGLMCPPMGSFDVNPTSNRPSSS